MTEAVHCTICKADVRYGFTVETTERISYMQLFVGGVAKINSSQPDGRVFCSQCGTPVDKTVKEMMGWGLN